MPRDKVPFYQRILPLLLQRFLLWRCLVLLRVVRLHTGLRARRTQLCFEFHPVHVTHDNRRTGSKAAAASLSVSQFFLDASLWANQGMSSMGWVHEMQCMLQELCVSWQCRERMLSCYMTCNASAQQLSYVRLK